MLCLSEKFIDRESIQVPRLAVVDEHLLALTTSLPEGTTRSSVAHAKTAQTTCPTLDADLVPTDVKFLVDGECVPAHRSFLSIASPTFNRMLNGDFREVHSDTVPIADVSARDFRDFLAWLYGNPSIVKDDNIMGLLRLSDQYLVEQLKQRCLSYVRYCEKTLIEKFVAAERYNSDPLQRYLVDYLTRSDAQKLVQDPSISALNSLTLKFLESLAAWRSFI